MKNHHQRCRTRSKHHTPTAKAVLTGLLACSLSTASAQQYTNNFEFPYDVKQYSTEMVFGTQDETVMAGTISMLPAILSILCTWTEAVQLSGAMNRGIMISPTS